jgi:hypothetical protein
MKMKMKMKILALEAKLVERRETPAQSLLPAPAMSHLHLACSSIQVLTSYPTIRRAPPQKAWNSSVNPITQKNSSQPQQNGNITQQKLASPGKAVAPKENMVSDKHAHDRLTFILAASMVR